MFVLVVCFLVLYGFSSSSATLTLETGKTIVGGHNFAVKHNALTAEQRSRIVDVYRACKRNSDNVPHKPRYFGTPDGRFPKAVGEEAHGHTVTFMNNCFDQQLLDTVTQAAVELIQHQIATIPFPEYRWDWQHLYNDFKYGMLQPRVVEYIYYENYASLGWHKDDDSVLTFVSLIANHSAFTGGDFLIRNNDYGDEETLISFQSGDAILFSSTADHMVTPVSGIRTVLCVEWWYLPKALEFAKRIEPESQIHFLRHNVREYHAKYDIMYDPSLYHWTIDWQQYGEQLPQLSSYMNDTGSHPYAMQDMVGYSWLKYWNFDEYTRDVMMEHIAKDKYQRQWLYDHYQLTFPSLTQ